MSIDKAEVYRKAAEVIVRDGKYDEGTLVEIRPGDGKYPSSERRALMDPSRPVCALGACARAEWELYRTMPDDVYEEYSFKAPWETYRGITMHEIFYINDDDSATAEDIAMCLKRRAEEVQGG